IFGAGLNRRQEIFVRCPSRKTVSARRADETAGQTKPQGRRNRRTDETAGQTKPQDRRNRRTDETAGQTKPQGRRNRRADEAGGEAVASPPASFGLQSASSAVRPRSGQRRSEST